MVNNRTPIKEAGRIVTHPDRPDRANKRMVACFLDADAFREFKILVAEQDSTTDGMVNKAIALLFESYGRPAPKSIVARLKTLFPG